MTTPPKYLGLLRNGGSDNTNALEDGEGFPDAIARRFGRFSQLDNAVAGQDYLFLPTVEEWPNAVDFLGQSYPADIVGVRFLYVYQQAGDSPSANRTAATRIVAVPSTLPTGYTLRPERDHQYASFASVSFFGNSNGVGRSLPLGASSTTGVVNFWPATNAAGSYRIRSPQALSLYTWLPENGGWARATVQRPSAQWTAATVGFRYFRFNWTPSGPGPSLTAAITYNNDGSSSPTPGANTAWTATYAGSAGTSGFVHTQIESPLGTRRAYHFRVFNPTTPLIEGNFTGDIGPRCDIPFPFTATGLNGLVAPGGVIPGLIPGY